MITLDVHDYCHDCPNFKADCVSNVLYRGDQVYSADYVIRCENKLICENIQKHLEKKEDGLATDPLLGWK